MRYAIWILCAVMAACDDGGSSAEGAFSAPGEGAFGAPGEGSVGEIPPGGAGRLTAGEWSDHEHWDFWLGLHARQDVDPEQALATFGLVANHRFIVEIQGDDGPGIDQLVELLDAEGQVVGQARSDVRGQAHLFPDLDGQATGPFRVQAADGESVAARPDETVSIVSPGLPPPETLDVMFLIDTTGSMCDELTCLQEEVADVIHRAGQDIRVRTAVGVYRDEGDAYVTRVFPFRTEPAAAATDLRAQSCDGGGDFPEAVDHALVAALDEAWSERALARVLFLVLDAPPHDGSQAVIERLHETLRRAQAAGVRVVPVAASGIDKNTEFLMRGLALLTGGTYVFLTDHSGLGNTHLEPTVGPYEVELLNDLLVRLLAEAAGR